MTKRAFETEVDQLLHLIVHSLYSNPEIFLRELISNASDALDKLKHLTLVDEHFKQVPFEPRIDIAFDPDGRSLTVSDTGIGMDEQDLGEQLGTIARSGTRAFVEQLSGDQRRDATLIGQFGVGFYSAFMVADFVEVTSRKAGQDKAWRWHSTGEGGYEIEPAEREQPGTTVELRLNDKGRPFAERWTLEAIVKKYSNHISFPIFLHYEEVRSEGEGDEKRELREPKQEQVNEASALWRQPKRELTQQDYDGFYQSLAHDDEGPLLTVHTQAEGTLEYTTLLFVPRKAPPDLYYADYRSNVRLYIKRVFVTDDDKELLPTWLRFVHGIIDSEDLPLNVSREMLQQNPVMERIRNAAVDKLIDEFEALAADEQRYAEFWQEFGRPLKEGAYHDWANRARLIELLRFKSTGVDGWTGLAGYVERMGEEQKAIYYLAGDKEQNLRRSPLLEAYRERDIEVLLMGDEVDEIIVPALGKYRDLELRSVQRAGATEELQDEASSEAAAAAKPLLERIKRALGDAVRDVRASARLSDSPSCIVLDDQDASSQMRGLLKSLGRDLPEAKPILEVNPSHPIVTKLGDVEDEELFTETSRLLLDQAQLVEGRPLAEPADFVRRLNAMLKRSL